MSVDGDGETSASEFPSNIVSEVKSSVTEHISEVESMQTGEHVPNAMELYLAGYIDSQYRCKNKLEELHELMKHFDEELIELRPRTCYNCGYELGELWETRNEKAKENNTHPADCPECSDNPLPPVGNRLQP